jgi:hypothetical protein
MHITTFSLHTTLLKKFGGLSLCVLIGYTVLREWGGGKLLKFRFTVERKYAKNVFHLIWLATSWSIYLEKNNILFNEIVDYTVFKVYQTLYSLGPIMSESVNCCALFIHFGLIVFFY